MRQTKVKAVMTSNPQMISPDSTLQEAADMMRSIGCGVLPVGSKNGIEGVITDRDIVIRAIADGKNPAEEIVRSCMTPEVHSCSEEDTLEQAADSMCQHNVSRLLVQDSNSRPSGILTFGSILRKDRNQQEVNQVVQTAVQKKAA